MTAPLTLNALRDGGKAALARALAFIEAKPDAPETVSLLFCARTPSRG